jgi:hypothetical protein
VVLFCQGHVFKYACVLNLPGDFGPDLSRGCSAMKTWWTLKVIPLSCFKFDNIYLQYIRYNDVIGERY